MFTMNQFHRETTNLSTLGHTGTDAFLTPRTLLKHKGRTEHSISRPFLVHGDRATGLGPVGHVGPHFDTSGSYSKFKGTNFNGSKPGV